MAERTEKMIIDRIEKVELHCHIDGLLCPSYVKTLQAKGFCNKLDLGQMQRLYPVKSLDDWFRLCEYLDPYVNNNGELLLKVLRLYLRDLALQNVKYSEITLSSFLFQYKDQDLMEQLMQSYRTAATEAREIEVSFLWAVGRSPDRAGFERKIERVLSLWRKGYIDGLVLAGDEKGCKVKDYAEIFKLLADEGVPVEIHAGEWSGPESIWDALEYGHLRRIGHGLSLFDDPELPEYIRKRNIHIEFCPSSNLKLTGIHRIEDHPIFRALDYGLNFSINTDDPGHFECTMNSEFRLLQTVRPLNRSFFKQVFRNSLAAAFRKGSKRDTQPDAALEVDSTAAHPRQLAIKQG